MLVASWISLILALRSAGSSRWLPLAASGVLHASALLAAGHAALSDAAPSESISAPLSAETVIDVETQALATPKQVAAEPKSASVPRQHRHSYPVPATHDLTPHDPNLKHLPLPVPAPQIVQVPDIAPAAPAPDLPAAPPEPQAPRFALRAMASALAGEPAPASSASERLATEASQTFSEREVDEPARLRSTVSAVYPEAARSASIEADVAVELVVDASGRVVSAKALSAPGYGLEEAALATVRGYRFTPARRAGQPVRVRLRSTVSFRLR